MDPKPTPDSDIPPPGFPAHPEGFEDGYFEDFEDDDQPDDAYPENEGW